MVLRRVVAEVRRLLVLAVLAVLEDCPDLLRVTPRVGERLRGLVPPLVGDKLVTSADREGFTPRRVGATVSSVTAFIFAV